MDQLPLELVQRILAHVDLRSLRNAALSCRTLLNAFKGAEELIAGEALLRQIGYDVLPEAILVDISSRLGEQSVEKARDFAQKYLVRREAPPVKWKYAHALKLADFHQTVHLLALRAANDALERQPRLQTPSNEIIPPVDEEISRFERALYRCELYRHLFSTLGPRDFEDMRSDLETIFFDNFATWENEQLGCIHDFLVRIVAEPFNFLVEHDVTWGYLRIPYIDLYSCDHGQALIAEGLEKIYQLSQASGYEEIHACLSRGEDRDAEPDRLTFYLSKGLEYGANPFIPPLEPISHMTEYDRELVLGEPFYRDPDPGPASMWKHMCRDSYPGELVYTLELVVHRAWGYPFWNASRLEAAGLLEDPNLPGLWERFALPFLDMYRDPERLEYLETMREARLQIWQRNGVGAYYYNDTTQIRWPVTQYDHPRKIRIPDLHSLDEAKAFLKNISIQS